MQYGKWNPQHMKNVLEEYKKGGIELNKCCEKYEFPKDTWEVRKKRCLDDRLH